MSDEKDTEEHDNGALDWLVHWASSYPDVAEHYFHIVDGRHATCGCFYEGETS